MPTIASDSEGLADALNGVLDDLSPSTSSVDRIISDNPTGTAEFPFRPGLMMPSPDDDTTAKLTARERQAKLLHKRSRSDTTNLLEQLKREEDLQGRGGNTTAAATTAALQSVGVTFAETMPSRDSVSQNSSFIGSERGRRRFSESGAVSSSVTSAASTPTILAPVPPTLVTAVRGRVYRSSIANDKLTTRDIAALDFLLGIPLEAEESIVQHGWMLQQRRLEGFQASSTDFGDDYGSDDEFENSKREETLEPPTTNAHHHYSAKTGAADNKLPINSHHGRWWEKWIPRDPSHHRSGIKDLHALTSSEVNKRKHTINGELELPTDAAAGLIDMSSNNVYGTPTTDDATATTSVATARLLGKSATDKPNMTAPVYAPGRRLEGDEAILVQIPLKIDTVTRQKSIARQAAIREWEINVAHGLGMSEGVSPAKPCKSLLDGRMFLSAAGSYPVGVFSMKRYEPKREEAALRRQKLEARGGGGAHFVMPSRDWRGISYRALLPRGDSHHQKAFNRFLRGTAAHPESKKKRRKKKASNGSDSEDEPEEEEDGDATHPRSDNDVNSDSEDEDDSSTSSSSSEDTYIPGILDDPGMTLGRHRNVMIGDVVTGCIVASTIQFVKPALLKADLNAKFRDRFDGWEPNQSQRKYIGARVVDGVYTLIDPTEESTQQEQQGAKADGTGKINTSAAPIDIAAATPAIIRMPPSLTLSKIRSVKRQALMAFVRAGLEVGTVALACVYFERLCLSCRVDKSNRRLCFASCLLLASKINEPNDVLVMKEDNTVSGGTGSGDEEEKRNTNTRKKLKRLQSSIRPSKRSTSMFASLLEFFTQEWSLSLKHLYAAEWGVFAALRFSLHATPSQVAFHFKRLMKTLEWNPALYLGTEMFEQWQEALATEEERTTARAKRREARHVRKQRRIQRELQKEVNRNKNLMKAEKRVKSASKGKGSSIFQQTSQQSLTGKIAVKKTKPLRDMAAENISRVAAEGNASMMLDDSITSPTSRKGVIRTHSLKSLVVGRSKSPHRSPHKDLGFGGASGIPRLPVIQREGVSSTPNTPGGSSSKANKGRSRKLLSRFGMRRAASSEKLDDGSGRDGSPKHGGRKSTGLLGLPHSPSMPLMALSTLNDTFQAKDEELGDTRKVAAAVTPASNVAIVDTTDPSKSVVIDMPPDDLVDLSNDGEADVDDDASDLGIII